MSQRLYFHAEQLERRDCPAGFTLTPIVDTVVEGSPAEFRIDHGRPITYPPTSHGIE